MQLKALGLWNKYAQYCLDHFFSHQTKNIEDGLPYLRDKLFITIFLITLPICCIVYIPSVLVSVITQVYIIGVFDTIALIFVFIVFFNKNFSIKFKKIYFSVIFYLLAIMLVYYLGIEGPGMIILICTSVLITLFQSRRAGILSAVLNLFVYVFVLILLDTSSENLIFFKYYTVQAWIGIGVNLFAFNLLVVLSVSSLIQHLNLSFLKERDLQELLKKESLELILAKEKAEESDRLKSAFLANMSHEIRTPMNGIIGFTTLLSEPGLEGEEKKEYLEIIKKCGSRMLDTINDIVELSKIESGHLDISRNETYVNEHLEYIFAFFKRDAENKGLFFKLKTPLATKETLITTDSKKFVSILSNLVKNALKYTNKGSIEFGYIAKPDEFEFFVTDTGIGIPADRHEAIFERFVQADIEDKKAQQGSGLGLSIAKSYVELLGGKIWVQSKPENGSSFFFTLPRYKADADKFTEEMADKNTERPIVVKDLNILVVEDDYASSVLISKMLSKIGKKITTAQTGFEAVDVCRTNSDLDLVLMDIKLPEMNGYEATRKIREFNKDVIIIAQTAHAMEGDRDKALEAGCNEYVSKPVIQSDLLLLIQDCFIAKSVKNVNDEL